MIMSSRYTSYCGTIHAQVTHVVRKDDSELISSAGDNKYNGRRIMGRLMRRQEKVRKRATNQSIHREYVLTGTAMSL